MIGHEKVSTADMSAGMFAEKAINEYLTYMKELMYINALEWNSGIK